MDSLRIVVSGLLAQYPLGGVTWDYLQYVLGFHRLGHDVYYVEDTGQWPFNPRTGGIDYDEYDFNVSYLADVMRRFDLGDRWAYCFPRGRRWFGMEERRVWQVVEEADLLVNVSGILARPERYRDATRMVFIDSDPVFTQVKLARGQEDFRQAVDVHDVHMSFGECLPNDVVPDTGHTWIPTRQPVVLSEWEYHGKHREVFTTVMNWTSYKPVEWEGHSFGQKDVEFRKFLDLPELVAPTSLEIAVNEGKTSSPPRDLQRYRGWQVVDPSQVCPDLDSYRDYIQTSMGEWSVAKNGYVVGQPGWFSGRTACYLAAGRPAVVQETGFSEILPTGEGLLSFETIEEAVAGVQAVEADYDRHSRRAVEIANEYFDSDRVLPELIRRAFDREPAAQPAQDRTES